MEQIKKYLTEFVNNPFNAKINFNLGYAYEIEKQYASAFSYYLRCAEFTEDKVLASEALLRCSLCLSNQGGRDSKELYLIKHAITASPNSVEPYYIASLYFSWRSGKKPEERMWLDSYMYACMGINILENNIQTKSFKYPVKYSLVDIYCQKAWTGSEIGKNDEAREIYTKILSTFEISDTKKNDIIKKMSELPEPSHPVSVYSNDKLSSLKFNFEKCNKIENNYSQIYQDMFVGAFVGKKRNTILVGSKSLCGSLRR